MITVEQLKKMMPHLPSDRAILYFPHLSGAMESHDINTPLRIAAFIAQIGHESLDLSHWTENLNYSVDGLLSVFRKYFPEKSLAEEYARKPEKIANRIYANRMGNGNEQTGDGWKYRGRGPIQLTGKVNYELYGSKLSLDLVGSPDIVATPDAGFKVASLFWSLNGLNALADAEDMAAITKKINGGLNGIEDRMIRYSVAINVLTGRS